jgi:hypothetical protein
MRIGLLFNGSLTQRKIINIQMRQTVFTALLIFFSIGVSAQHLRPGFDKEEFMELLRINARFSESAAKAKLIPLPNRSVFVYKSPVIGLANLWQLWLKDGNVGVISTRGTTREGISWLANLYAAQVPAKGTLTIDTNFVFNYDLAQHPHAAVHVGYLLSSAFLIRDMLPKIDSCYKSGIKDFIIAGHSQGGGLSYILTAYFLGLQRLGQLPADIRFKTYTSASPKPGNLYFAYEYEHLTRGGWAFNVTSTEDWVPQTPSTVQTLEDFPTVNPLPLLQQSIKTQPLLKRLFLRKIVKNVMRPSQKTVSVYEKYLGTFTAKNIRKKLPQFKEPTYSRGSNYVRAGAQIVLYPDREYYRKFPVPEDNRDIMFHHSLPPYYYLVEQYDVPAPAYD